MNRSGLGLAFRLLGLGWYIAGSIILGTGSGLWLDRRLGTLPLFTLLGVVTGGVVALYGVYRLVSPLMKDEDH